MGPARDVREWACPRGAARLQIRPAPAFLGSAYAQAPADNRLRGQVSARVRAAASARPDQGLRLRELRAEPGGSFLIDLDVAPRRRQVGGDEDHRYPRRA